MMENEYVGDHIRKTMRFYLSIFSVCIFLALINYYHDYLPIGLGEFGRLLVFIGDFSVKIFLPWQYWAIALISYVIIGYRIFIILCHAASGGRGVIYNPEFSFIGMIAWALLWPLLLYPIRMFLRIM